MTTTFHTYAQYLQACTERAVNSHRPPAAPYFWVCAGCGKCAPHSESYGTDGKTEMVCYDCCAARDVEQMLDRSKPFYAYLSCDGRELVNWPGRSLGRVLNYSESRAGWNGGTIARFRVLDVHGQLWAGRGAGKGMFCTLRAMKG